MNTLLRILVILALASFTLPAVSFAAPEMVIVSEAADSGADAKPGADASTRSWLANDLFHRVAHACDLPSATCGPDNIVTNAFGARINLFVPTTQSYTIYWMFTDIEGNAIVVAPFTQTLTGGTFVNAFLTGVTLPTSSSVATRGLYKFLSLVVGANGIAAFSDYYRLRVTP